MNVSKGHTHEYVDIAQGVRRTDPATIQQSHHLASPASLPSTRECVVSDSGALSTCRYITDFLSISADPSEYTEVGRGDSAERFARRPSTIPSQSCVRSSGQGHLSYPHTARTAPDLGKFFRATSYARNSSIQEAWVMTGTQQGTASRNHRDLASSANKSTVRLDSRLPCHEDRFCSA